MKRVYVIGDSISIGYTPFVEGDLAGVAEVVHNPGNGEDSGNVLRNLEEWTAGEWDVIHLNCGLHDLKRVRGSLEVVNKLDVYERNLREIFGRLMKRGVKVVWATTTPVVDERHAKRLLEIDRNQKDVLAYNEVAGRVLREFPAIAVTDLHGVVVGRGAEEMIAKDGVHYDASGYRILADAVTAGIRRALGG